MKDPWTPIVVGLGVVFGLYFFVKGIHCPYDPSSPRSDPAFWAGFKAAGKDPTAYLLNQTRTCGSVPGHCAEIRKWSDAAAEGVQLEW